MGLSKHQDFGLKDFIKPYKMLGIPYANLIIHFL